MHLGTAASVQFARPILFRVIRIHDDWSTYVGWIWLDGYELNNAGDAVERRSVFVQISGIRPVSKSPDRRPANTRPVVAPQRSGDPAQKFDPDRRVAQHRRG